MAERKPVLLAVDDDREVVRAIERDLRNHYARDFTVLAAGSGEEALELIRRLVPRGDPLGARRDGSAHAQDDGRRAARPRRCRGA